MLRSASGYALVRTKMLGHRTGRFLELKSTVLDINQSIDSRHPLLSVNISGASLSFSTSTGQVLIRADGHKIHLQFENELEFRVWKSALEYSARKIEHYYKLVSERQLGRGRTSEVVFGFDNQSGEHVAVKVIDKAKSSKCNKEFTEREVILRLNVKDERIVSTLNVFETKFDVFVVSEYMSGGNLANMLMRRRAPLSELDARIIMFRLFGALKYLHSNDIIHRNVKTENVLFSTTEADRWASTVKLSDLALATHVDDPETQQRVVGSPEFMAPEASFMTSDGRGGRHVDIGVEADMWSAGVLLFNILSLEMPFDGETIPDILKKVRKAEFSFEHPSFEAVSNEAKSLITGLLNPDRQKRYTARTVLLHKWFSKRPEKSKRPRKVPTGLAALRASINIIMWVNRLADITPGVRRSKLMAISKKLEFGVVNFEIAPGPLTESGERLMDRDSPIAPMHFREHPGFDVRAGVSVDSSVGSAASLPFTDRSQTRARQEKGLRGKNSRAARMRSFFRRESGHSERRSDQFARKLRGLPRKNADYSSSPIASPPSASPPVSSQSVPDIQRETSQSIRCESSSTITEGTLIEYRSGSARSGSGPNSNYFPIPGEKLKLEKAENTKKRKDDRDRRNVFLRWTSAAKGSWNSLGSRQ